MKLLTAEIKKKLDATPVMTHDGKKASEIPVIVKFFSPVGRYTFYVTEAEEMQGEYSLYGFCVSPMEQSYDEMGYVLLGELQSIQLPMGLGIERDISFEGTLLDAMKAHDHDYAIYENESIR